MECRRSLPRSDRAAPPASALGSVRGSEQF